MQIWLDRAGPADRELLYRLLQYSLYEESAHDGNVMGPDGLFEYPWFDLYFTDPDREAYLIRARAGGEVLGFIMVNTVLRRVASGHSVAEFLVLPAWRRRGVGRAAARACFQAHPGTWEVGPSLGSEAAFIFWEKTIAGWTGSSPRLEEDVFIFSSISR